ncbi:hypothetical protein [Streptomyces sp. SID4982]|uniref:hypothetical protein n=1 Tax=Streptomyces sp. SID4982 TaxID=2690291 RepID=UPI00136EA030|nr:hypothetical protein [Streptomyces sp. SID4982]MYS15166.1 hypothetical protein [Streptomyces sp. SID4982]
MASTTRQTTAARKRTPVKPTGGGGLDFEPIRIAANEDVPEERVPLFYIGDTEYTIPKKIPKGVALQYLRKAAEVGHELATAPLLVRVLGEEAYTALEESEALDDEQLDSIVNIIVKQALGSQEKEGKARRG